MTRAAIAIALGGLVAVIAGASIGGCGKSKQAPSAAAANPLAARLLAAVEGEDLDGARALLEQGAAPNAEFDPQAAARERRRLEAEMQKRQSGAARRFGVGNPLRPEDLPTLPDVIGPDARRMPLRLAVERDSAPMIRLLLGFGADVNQRDSGGRTALGAARTLGTAEALLAAGADPLAVDVWGDDCFDHVVGVSEAGVVEEADVGGETAARDRGGIARLLLAAGAPLDRRHDGQTRLYRAAFKQNPDAVAMLLELGHPVVPNDDGAWPLHAICWHLDWDDDTVGGAAIERIVRSLVGAGHDVNAPDAAGDTPLHVAVWGDGPSVSAIRALLDLGANPAARNKEGKTPLDMYAMTDGDSRGRALLEAAAAQRAP